jgi:serine/threonine protein kinase
VSPVSEVGALEDRVGAALAVSELAGAPAPRLDHRYRLTHILGRGANGVVVAAHDERLDREVALKLFAEWDERVLREARSIAKLDHPNVIRVYDVGVGDLQVEGEAPVSCAYLCMALVRGKSLRAWLAEDKPGDSRIRAVLAAAGEGLAAAHAAGLVHRDIKPENIMVGPGDEALVVDFGLARPPPENGALATLAGTPPYMAPEARAGQVSAAADVYAFARVTVEALSGALPTDERGLDAVLDDLGRRLDKVLRRALDSEPKRRPAVPALVRALGRPRRSMVWSLLLVAIFLFAVAHQNPKFRLWFYGLFDGHTRTFHEKH